MEMTREALLNLAKQWPDASNAMLRLADQVVNVEAVEATKRNLHSLLTVDEVRANRLAHLSVGCFFGAFMTLAGAIACTSPLGALLSLGLLLLFVWSAIASDVNSGRATECATQLAELMPIAGTEKCFRAQELVERAHPSVLAWRDIAISDRGQLYGFDVEVMAYLHQQTEGEALKTDAQKRIEEACRKAHGLVPANA